MNEGECCVVSSVSFFGHVDSGKSSLVGRILVDTGIVNNKETLKPGFKYSHITDELEEERDRGITVDFVVHTYTDERYAINLVDTPGHIEYLPNTIKGITQAEIGVFVIDASSGSFEAASRCTLDDNTSINTHILLAKSLGISDLIIAINKMDNVDYSQTRFTEIANNIKNILKKYKFVDFYSIVPISVHTGANVISNSKDLCYWYEGSSLWELIKKASRDWYEREAGVTGWFIYTVSDFFEGKGGIIKTSGRVLSGVTKVGSKLFTNSTKDTLIVKDITSNQKTTTETRFPDYSEISFKNADVSYFSRGMVLTDQKGVILESSRLKCTLFITASNAVVTPGFNCLFFCHNISEPTIVKIIDQKKGKCTQLQPTLRKGECGVVTLEFDAPVSVMPFSKFKKLGRFILYHSSKILGVGTIDETF